MLQVYYRLMFGLYCHFVRFPIILSLIIEQHVGLDLFTTSTAKC